MSKDKQVLVDFDIHKKLKIRATKKGKAIKTELKEILTKELEVDDSNE